jgi:hypothetical protein
MWTLCPRRKRRWKKCHLPYFNNSWAQSWRDQEFKCMLLFNWSGTKLRLKKVNAIFEEERGESLSLIRTISFPFLIQTKKWAHYSFSVSDINA